ncbi:hypothetical protein G6F68_012908 [Rhizopus microsporus]|nr:hypothetical protein G6F68_012908 [Rhizopus microsporus]
MPPMRAASSCMRPRRLTSAPLSGRLGWFNDGSLVASARFGFSAPPRRTARSPPPVRCSVPSASTRPVEPTAATTPDEWRASELTTVPLATPASRPAARVRLPPPSVPKPMKPTMRAPLVAVDGAPATPRLPWRHSQLPTALGAKPAPSVWLRGVTSNPTWPALSHRSPRMSRPAETVRLPPWSGYQACHAPKAAA